MEKNDLSKCITCVGYGYVPIQELNKTFAPCNALENGTIFPELNLTIKEYGTICKSGGKE